MLIRLELHAADRHAEALHSAYISPRRVKTGTRTDEMAPSAREGPLTARLANISVSPCPPATLVAAPTNSITDDTYCYSVIVH